MIEINYRQATSNDFLEIAKIDREAWNNNENSRFIPDGEHAWKLWCEYSLVLCAEIEEQIIGAALSFKTDIENLYAIHKIFVIKRHQNDGIGSRLMKLTIDKISNKKMDAFLTVDPKNTKAVKLYRNMGFEQESFIKGYYRSNEDRLVMKYRSEKQCQ